VKAERSPNSFQVGLRLRRRKTFLCSALRRSNSAGRSGLITVRPAAVFQIRWYRNIENTNGPWQRRGQRFKQVESPSAMRFDSESGLERLPASGLCRILIFHSDRPLEKLSSASCPGWWCDWWSQTLEKLVAGVLYKSAEPVDHRGGGGTKPGSRGKNDHETQEDVPNQNGLGQSADSDEDNQLRKIILPSVPELELLFLVAVDGSTALPDGRTNAKCARNK